MPKSPVSPSVSEKKKKSSPDYSRLARGWLEASGDEALSKLPAGLYLVATPIGNLGDISLRALTTLNSVDRIACEDTRNSGLLLAKYGIKKPLWPCHDHNEATIAPKFIEAIASGEAVALISDAGMPLVSDPGYRVVQACHEAQLLVSVIPGANAAIAALACSGMAVDQFLFAGFLPAKTTARQKAINELKDVPGTLVFYEAPQRLSSTLEDFVKILGGERPAAVARELTKLYEEIKRGSLSELRTFYASYDVKGEIVILVGQAKESTAVAYDIDDLLKDHLRTLSVRDAVSAVSSITGMKKSEVYARALWLAGKSTR